MTRDFNALISEWEWFIGRDAEKRWIQSYLENKDPGIMVLNIYGTGGIGKSTLLEYFRSAAKKNAISFLSLDSRDFSHTPAGFADKLLQCEIAGSNRVPNRKTKTRSGSRFTGSIVARRRTESYL